RGRAPGVRRDGILRRSGPGDLGQNLVYPLHGRLDGTGAGGHRTANEARCVLVSPRISWSSQRTDGDRLEVLPETSQPRERRALIGCAQRVSAPGRRNEVSLPVRWIHRLGRKWLQKAFPSITTTPATDAAHRDPRGP